MFKNFLIFGLINLCYGFNYNPITKQTVMFFPLQINHKDQVPLELYNNFLSCLSINNIDVHKSSSNIDKDCDVLEKIISQNDNITLLSHSTGVNNLLKVYNKFNKINNIALIDPILLELNKKNPSNNFNFDDFEESINDILENDKMTILKNIIFKKTKTNKEHHLAELSNPENLLYITSEKSNRWKIFPTVPPIKRLYLDFSSIKNENKIFKQIPNYGHFDLLDNQWSDMIHKSICKGNNDRDNNEAYHNEIAQEISKLNLQ